MAKYIAAEKAGAGLRHAVACPNVTGRTKERITQSNRRPSGLVGNLHTCYKYGSREFTSYQSRIFILAFVAESVST